MTLSLKRFCIGAAFVIGATLMSNPASAMILCWVKKTPDGFVALRSGPNADSRMIAKMRGGDIVWGDPDRTVRPRNGWTYVNWVKQSTYDKTMSANAKIDGKGWVRESLIEEIGRAHV